MSAIKITNPTIDNFTIECNFDADMMKAMLKDDSIAKDDRKLLKNINKHKKNHNTINDTYTWTNEGKYGRVYCSSLQMLSKEYRNGLLNGNCFELDMKNAHYTLLEQIGKEFELPTTHIAYYNNNREECLTNLNSDRTKAKELYLMAEYGCEIEQLRGISNECKTIFLRLSGEDDLKDLYKYAEKQFKKKSGKFKSLLHSFGAFYLQTLENRCMFSILDYISQKNSDINDKIKVQIILHDGLIIKKSSAFTDELIKEIEEFVFDDNGFKIKLDKKDCVTKYESPTQDYISIQDDEDACNYLKKHYGNKIVHANDDWYCHLPNTNCWSKGLKCIRAMIKELNFYIIGENGDKPYSSTTSGMNKIIEYLEKNCSLLFPIDTEFINNVNRKTEGLVFYLDKYYDFNNHVFLQIQTDNLPIIFENRIAPDLTTITDYEIKNYVSSYLNMFRNDERPLILKAFSRALAGHVSDKIWYSMCGLRNTGKGVFQTGFNYSFGSYTTTFDMPMIKTSNKQDASDYRWVVSTGCHLKRVGFANEVQSINGLDPIIDGGAIKKVIASGGDDIITRGLYKDEAIVKNNMTAFASLNGNPDASPKDALSNCIPFKMPYKFVDFPNDITEFKSDDNIKKKMITERNRDIFTKIIFNAYGGKVLESEMTERMKEDLKEICHGNVNEPLYILRNKFRKPTQQEIDEKNDWTAFAEIKDEFKFAKMSDTALGRFLKERGYANVMKTVFKKNDTRAYKIKITGNVIDDTDVETED